MLKLLNILSIMIIFTLIAIISIVIKLNLKSKFKKKKYSEQLRKYENELSYKKGEIGENLLISMLNKKYPDFIILNNLYIPISDSKTTQIDVVALHTTGIYVFECKNFYGKIYGGLYKDYWYEFFKGSNKKFSLFNPLIQNKYHIDKLNSILKIKNKYFHSIVTFTTNSKICDNLCNSENIKILNDDFSLNIKNKKNVFSKEEVDELYFILYKFTNASDEIKLNHILAICNK